MLQMHFVILYETKREPKWERKEGTTQVSNSEELNSKDT